MRLVYLMDPLETMLPDKDTTFAFLRSAERRGHENLHARIGDLTLVGDDLTVRARRAFVSDEAPHTRYGEALEVSLADVDAVLVRKDPPFDQAYLYATLLLEHVRGRTLVVNDPRALRDANEKLYALQFPEWTPRTMVSSDRDAIRAFIDRVGGRGVIKPLDGAGGWGVMGLRTDDSNARAIVDMLTLEGTKLAMAQEFLPAVREGDKRVLLLDGEPLGAILRVPRADDIRSNIHVGGSVVPTELTPRERELVASVGPRLAAAGLYFVGLDVIGERLTEVNVTSPTGIQQMSRFAGEPLEDRVIAWIERKVGQA